MTQLEQEIKSIILENLDLPIEPTELQAETLLFDPEHGLGLDSLEALEIATCLSTNYRVNFEESDIKDFESIKTLAQFIEKHQVVVAEA